MRCTPPVSYTHLLGVGQIVDAEGHIAQGLALDVHGVGLPQTGTDEYALVAVAEQVVDGAVSYTHLAHRLLYRQGRAGSVCAEQTGGSCLLYTSLLTSSPNKLLTAVLAD